MDKSTNTIDDLVARAASVASDDTEIAIHIAQQLLERSRELQTPQERRQQSELDRMIGHLDDKATLVEMTDQAFRTLSPARVADQLTHILDLQGVPRFFSPLERTMLRGFQSFGEYLPGVAVPLVKDKMRRETANVILPAETEMLSNHLRERQREGLRMNVNVLGEALLGEDDAQRRLKKYLDLLRLPDIECVSVKITTIFSQVSPLARENTVRILADRLELLYRAANREIFHLADGSETSKFVYLDMEEYRDLELTADAMCRALDRSELQSVRAGIALQAYLPDSCQVLLSLIEWAKRRVENGGSPLTVRLVKGANMEMERVEASLGGWPQAPYTSKRETDANYKRMLQHLLDPLNVRAIRTGVASHNLFDVGLAIYWAHRNQVVDYVQFEMLEGMANHQRRALFEATKSMLLYAPACRREEFLNAIGYLVRRLDENTGEQNFLRHSFNLKPDTKVWDKLTENFRDSYASINTVSDEPRRTQNRHLSPSQPLGAEHWSQYINEPDTDWALSYHSKWAQALVETWQAKSGDAAIRIPLGIAGRERNEDGRVVQESFDPSRPEVVSCRFLEANENDIDDAVTCASDDPTRWRETSLEYRHDVLRTAAQLMRVRRVDLIGAAILDGGKTVAEADPEVSEAIDFTEFYPLTVRALHDRKDVQLRPRGVVAVVSPWNFPIAIPCGGVAAALAAGNTAILKPASDTVLPAYLIAQCFWDAGVPREVLHLTPCAGSRGAQRLIEDPRVQTVILTGGTSTAKRMLTARPGLHLIAETGGKNATIVSALSDRDLAIKHVLHSAFSHSGQKCSATSLLLLEDEVYEDVRFRENLADAVRSLKVGSAWDLASKVGPMIRPPSGDLARGMKELEPGESWLVMPERVHGNPQLYRPGVKWNVRPGGFTHRTELFGPVLGVMRYRRLEDAIGIVNATGYGLTSGLESLDDREREIWTENIRAGNLYINRSTTGAIVLRQPFGGVGDSAYGPGAKAGGPHYVIPLVHINDGDSIDESEKDSDGEHSSVESFDNLAILDDLVIELANEGFVASADLRYLGSSISSLRIAMSNEFSQDHDSVGLLGQANIRRYRSMSHMRMRIGPSDTVREIVVAIAAAVATETRLTVSHDEWSPEAEESQHRFEILSRISDHLPGLTEIVEESDDELSRVILGGDVDRLRVLSRERLAEVIYEACCDAFVSIIDDPVVGDGSIEALRYLSEQSVSFDYHRYGNLGRRNSKS